MFNELVDIDTDGNVFLHDKSVALLPSLFKVYKHKRMGSKMVKWIVSIYDYKSPYRKLPFEERKNEITFSIFGSKTLKLTEDKLVEEAIKEYERIQFDPLIEQYNAITEQIHKITIVYKDIKPTTKNLTELNKYAKEMREAAESREKIKQLIIKDQESETKVYGGGSEDFSLLEQKVSRTGS